MKARGLAHLVPGFFDTVFDSAVCRVKWTAAEQFHAVKKFFLKHFNQHWTFTDCLTFRVMKERRLRDALTQYGHFEQAGFVALLK